MPKTVYQIPIVCQMTNLLLASGSPRRRELLTLMGLSFEITTPSVDEEPQANEVPAALAARLSRAKARAACAVQDATTDPKGTAVIIACDTVVSLDGEILGKPGDATEAATMLRHLRRQSPHTVYSGFTLLDPASGEILTDVDKTQVTMRAYTDAEIDIYVASGDPLDKAGGYAIQHRGFHPVVGLEGCYANVMGFPLCHLTRCLREWGIVPPAHATTVPGTCQAHIGHDRPVSAAILGGEWGAPTNSQ